MSNTLGDILEFETFDPEKIDVSEITELTKSIPSDGNVDIAIAEVLATKFLRGADRCSEFLAKFTWWEAKTADDKGRAFAYASLVTAANKGLKTAIEKKTYADGDEAYLKACEISNRAKAMKQWFKNKQESFITAHYLMKEIAKGGKVHQKASGQPDGIGWGEQDWK